MIEAAKEGSATMISWPRSQSMSSRTSAPICGQGAPAATELEPLGRSMNGLEEREARRRSYPTSLSGQGHQTFLASPLTDCLGLPTR